MAYRGARIVDPRDGSCSTPRDILVRDGRVAQIAAEGQLCAGLEAVDASGRFVVPGYLDMHVHTMQMPEPEDALRLLLAFGITGMRQMGGAADLLLARRQGTLSLPACAPALLAMPGDILLPTNAGSPEMAVATVRRQKDLGADFIKVGMVSPAAYLAAQAEANRLGIPLGGHLPAGIDILTAVRAGFRFVEHLGPGVGVLSACCRDPGVASTPMREPPRWLGPVLGSPLLARALAPVFRKFVINPIARARPRDIDALDRAIDSFDPDLALRVAEDCIRHGTWHSPTLIRLKTQELAGSVEFSADPALGYMHPRTLKDWAATRRTFDRLPERYRATLRRAYDLQLAITGLFDKAGVRMIAGSDVGGAGWEVPGVSLHREFDELARAGLSPLRILQMTTVDAAEFLGLGATMGTIEVGKLADFVFLDRSPIDDVRNLHAIAGVVRGGDYYPRSALEAIKREIAQARSVH